MARAEDVTFETISRVYRDESQKRTLTPLELDFWDKVARYIASLHADLAAERGKNPNSKAVMLLQDELRKVEQKRDQIYQYRERKIGVLATRKVGGEEVETRGLARTEVALLDGLVAVLLEARGSSLGASPSAAPAAEEASPGPRAAPKPPKVAAKAPPADGVLVRVLEDVPPFAGPDRTYRLRKEDLVTLPAQLAKVLLDRGKAEIVRPTPPLAIAGAKPETND